MTALEAGDPLRLRVNDLGEYIRFNSCGRRFRLGVDNRAEAKRLPFAERLFNALDPVLQEVGRQAEDDWEASLRAHGFRKISSPYSADSFHWAEFAQELSSAVPGKGLFGREVSIAGVIGAAEVFGRMDFVVLRWEGGAPRLRVVEGKASRKDRTYHRLQVAAYMLLLEEELRRHPLRIAGADHGPEILECVVVRLDEETSVPQDALALGSLNLEIERADVERLLAADGEFAWLARQKLDSIDFQLSAKCDSCVFSVHCLPESGRARRLELLGLTPMQCHALAAGGVADIDQLADLDLASQKAAAIRQSDGFEADLPQLIAKAQARRATLPKGEDAPDDYPVQALPHAGTSQLPPYESNGQRLVRVYLQVHYDYTQNRVGALAAHVTASDHLLHTPFEQSAPGGRPQPAHALVERRPRSNTQPVQHDERRWSADAGREVVEIKAAPWAGIHAQDAQAEEELLGSFINRLVEAIRTVASEAQAPVHFYIFARSEMTQLMEACARSRSGLLGALRELLGCREGLEQLIFSCVQDEVDDRYALGWTGRGLAVMTSLPWFGWRFHWTRFIGGEVVALDRAFEQDIFDFKTTLAIREDGSWAGEGEGAEARFEIRSRFHDSLPAPYWRARWGTLPTAEKLREVDPRVQAAVRRYARAGRPGILEGYLVARAHALRWLEERIRFKNDELAKPALQLDGLSQFSLGVASAGRAALDYLQLDNHVRRTDWLASGLRPVSTRVCAGVSIPVRGFRAIDRTTLVGDLDLEPFGLDAEALAARCDIGEGSYARVAPRLPEPEKGQTLNQLRNIGCTAEVTAIDWDLGRISMELRPMRQPNSYVMRSLAPQQAWDRAVVSESVSDFVANRVEARLRVSLQHHAMDWLDPTHPELPPLEAIGAAALAAAAAFLKRWQAPYASGTAPLAPDQRAAVLDGLATRAQLLKGPPGTGKTATTAAAILVRAAFSLPANGTILVAANTHQAVDTLLRRLADYLPSFTFALAAAGHQMPSITLARIDPRDGSEPMILNVDSGRPGSLIADASRSGLLIAGGTTNGVLKLSDNLSARAFPNGPEAALLVVDEASMMVFPHFLALATLIGPDGRLLLAGDNRQLPPIVAHDWECEDRPPVQIYQPYRSAYDAMARIVEEAGLDSACARQSPLSYTFRLPPLVRELVGRVYARDGIILHGRQADGPPSLPLAISLEAAWNGPELVLITHDERQSRKQNALEVGLIGRLLAANPAPEPNSVAIVTPHRAQRHLLKTLLHPEHASVATVIDTVERLQGGERPTIIISATRSEPHSLVAAAGFVLNLNRANVAFSRARARLIVVCAQSLLDHVPSELEDYETAMLWKSLRAICRRELFSFDVSGSRAKMLVADR